jgi:hypothetical protein
LTKSCNSLTRSRAFDLSLWIWAYSGDRTTKALTIVCRFGSGEPTTADSATQGCS